MFVHFEKDILKERGLFVLSSQQVRFIDILDPECLGVAPESISIEVVANSQKILQKRPEELILMKIFIKFGKTAQFDKKYLNSIFILILKQNRTYLLLKCLHADSKLNEAIPQGPSLLLFHV